MKIIYVDIDETICQRETSVDFGTTHDYSKAKPIRENIEKINKLQIYFPAEASKIFFIHIGKTAGTTLNKLFQ